jgi:hypothetical protein
MAPRMRHDLDMIVHVLNRPPEPQATFHCLSANEDPPQSHPPNTISLQPLYNQPLNLRPSVIEALTQAHTILEVASTTPSYPHRKALLSRALDLSNTISLTLTNSLSPHLPHPTELAYARDLSLITNAAIITFLCANYESHCVEIRHHVQEIIRSHGYSRLPPEPDGRVLNVVAVIKKSIHCASWHASRRFGEWQVIASLIPEELNFAGLRYEVYQRILEGLVCGLRKFLGEKGVGRKVVVKGKSTVNGEGAVMVEVEDIHELIPFMEWFVEKFRVAAMVMGNEETHSYLPKCKVWKSPEHYRLKAVEFLAQVDDTRKVLEVYFLMRKGDALMEHATEKVRETDWEYFCFQVTMAMDSYRAGYVIIQSCGEVNVEIEGQCLWSMARVMGLLGLHEQAHGLCLQAVILAGTVSSRLPTGEWYTDAVEQIELRRKTLEEEETRTQERQRVGIMASLCFDLDELRCRADRVSDECSLREFFLWLVQTHKPRDPRFRDHAREALGPREPCKVALNIVAMYDVSKNTQFGDRWATLCEEIVKVDLLRSTNPDNKSLLRKLGSINIQL